MARNIAIVNTASASSASKDGTGAATPATSRAPKAISAGAINGTIRRGAPRLIAAVGQDWSRSFNAPESRKTAPSAIRAATDTGLTQPKVP
jgi:hypothetical protein